MIEVVTGHRAWRQNQHVRYRAAIEIVYSAGGERVDESIRGALVEGLNGSLTAEGAALSASHADVRLQPRNVVLVQADIVGRATNDLISPLDAITYLDNALLQALMRTGLFEEFDVARRSLRVGPTDR